MTWMPAPTSLLLEALKGPRGGCGRGLNMSYSLIPLMGGGDLVVFWRKIKSFVLFFQLTGRQGCCISDKINRYVLYLLFLLARKLKTNAATTSKEQLQYIIFEEYIYLCKSIFYYPIPLVPPHPQAVNLGQGNTITVVLSSSAKCTHKANTTEKNFAYHIYEAVNVTFAKRSLQVNQLL